MPNKRQLAAIHAAATECGLKGQDYYDFLWNRLKIKSSKEMNANTIRRYFAILRDEYGWKKTSEKKLYLNPKVDNTYREVKGEEMITKRQEKKILALWVTRSRNKDWQGLRHWLTNKFQVSDTRFLTRAKATKAIYALEKGNGWR